MKYSFRLSPFAFRHQGFTLVEVVVVAFFAALITSMVLIGYQQVSTAGSLQRAAQKVVQDVRTAQSFAITTDPTRFAGSTPPCGYGLHTPDPATPLDPNSYVIYARQIRATNDSGDPVDPATVDCLAAEPKHYTLTSASTTGQVIRSYVLPEAGRVRFRTTAVAGDFSTTDIYYLPPDPAVFLIDSSAGTPYVSPGPCPAIPCYVSIPVELVRDSTQSKTVQVYDSGRVEIQ